MTTERVYKEFPDLNIIDTAVPFIKHSKLTASTVFDINYQY